LHKFPNNRAHFILTFDDHRAARDAINKIEPNAFGCDNLSDIEEIELVPCCANTTAKNNEKASSTVTDFRERFL
jgi:hypothetical protein